MQNLFRLRIEADEAGQNQKLTFVDDGGPERESSLAVLVQWREPTLKPALESVFNEFVREYRDSGAIVSPGAFLERLVHSLDAAFGTLEPELLEQMDLAVALSSGRGLYLLHSTGFESRYALDGSPQPLVSSLRVRVKDLSPTTMRSGHLWSEPLVERLRLVRVFFEDEDRATLWLVLPEAPAATADRDLDLDADVDPLGATPCGDASIVVDKEPVGERVGVSAAGIDADWPEMDESVRRDRRTLSAVAVGLVVILFGTALVGMWRWQRAGAQARSDVQGLLSESVDTSLEPRASNARVSSEVVGGEARTPRAKDAPLQVAKADGKATGALAVLWSRRHSDWVTSSPRLAHGRVVYGCRDGQLYAVAPSGEEEWSYESGAGIGATPAVDGGRVFCGNYAGRAFALADKDGKELWSVELSGRIVASPAAGKKHVFFATQTGDIVALHKKDGRVAWRVPVGGKLRATPLAVGDRLYLPAAEGGLLCLEQKSGEVRWSYEAGSPVQSCPLLADGRLVFGCKDGTVHAVAAKDGKALWQLRTKGAVQGTPALGDDIVYVGSGDKRLYAIRLESGDVAWAFPTKAAILASPAVQDGKVYVNAYDRHTYVLDAASGRELAKLRLKAPIFSSPLVAEGRIFCGSNDGTVYCMSDVRN